MMIQKLCALLAIVTVMVTTSRSASGNDCSPECTLLGSGTNSQVRALAVFDDGTGPALYTAGFFTEAGGSPANYIAKWDGAAWSTLDGG